ncbi:MAG: flippase [Candidatus Binataceae bacterium]
MEDVGTNNGTSLTSGRRLILNVIWNGAGQIGPLAAAFIAMPILIHALGVERFGILALVWTVFGYFSLLDLGIGQALTKLTSDRLATGPEDEIPALFGTALAATVTFGLVGSVVLVTFAHPVVNHLFKVSPSLQGETLSAMYVLALGIPICVPIGTLRGTLSAYQRFGVINLVQSPNAILTSLAPLCVLPFSHNIALIVAVLFGVHAITWLVYFAMCMYTVPNLVQRMRFRAAMVPGLVGFGFWIASSNLVAVMMGSFDRFTIAALTGMEAVGYYIVPARILHKLTVVPWLITAVLYPAFAHSLASDRLRTRMLFDRGAKAAVLILFPIVLIVVVFARELMTLWVGAEFAAHSALLVQLLALAALFDGVGRIAAALNAAAHRPDVNTKIQSVELPLYLGFMGVMVYWRGAEGAAIACLVRAGADAAANWIAARVLLPEIAHGGRRLAWFMLAALSSMATAALSLDLEVKCLTVAVIIAILYAAAWIALLNNGDHQVVLEGLNSVRGFRPLKIAEARK